LALYSRQLQIEFVVSVSDREAYLLKHAN